MQERWTIYKIREASTEELEAAFGDPSCEVIPIPECTPTRWWRAVAPDGSVWAESSDEQEVRERARESDTVQHLWEWNMRGVEWRDA